MHLESWERIQNVGGIIHSKETDNQRAEQDKFRRTVQKTSKAISQKHLRKVTNRGKRIQIKKKPSQTHTNRTPTKAFLVIWWSWGNHKK